MNLKMRLECSDKTLYFELKHFFQIPLEFFLWALRERSMYLLGPSNPDVYVSKKIVIVQRINQKILFKKLKHIFLKMPWHDFSNIVKNNF